MTDVRLTERQRQFAEEHHKVLTDFLTNRKLPADEFYDVVVFRFLNAVRQYDEHEDLKQYAFADIAENQMRQVLKIYFRNQRQQEKCVRLFSLETPVSQYPDMTLGDVIADDAVNVCDEVCEKLSRSPKRYRLLHISKPLMQSMRLAV